MAYKVIERYDAKMPSSEGNGIPFSCIFGHDTEGGTGVAGALGTIQFLIDTASQRNASYHEVWAFEEGSGDFTVIRIVPPNRAAHSVNPWPPPTGSYQPTDAAKKALGANATNPNQGAYAVSIAGKVADVNRYATNPTFLGYAGRRLTELQAELKVSQIIEHFQINPSTRSDWGKQMTPALTLATAEEDPAMIAELQDEVDLLHRRLRYVRNQRDALQTQVAELEDDLTASTADDQKDSATIKRLRNRISLIKSIVDSMAKDVSEA